jgi:hypothetical protein
MFVVASQALRASIVVAWIRATCAKEISGSARELRTASGSGGEKMEADELIRIMYGSHCCMSIGFCKVYLS